MELSTLTSQEYCTLENARQFQEYLDSLEDSLEDSEDD